jgi:protoheme ferro-lyase
VTEDLADRIVTLPLYPHMSAADVDAVTSGVLEAVWRSESARARSHATSIGGTTWN